MSLLQGLLHVNLTIAPGPEALEQCRRFYVEGLGLEELYRPPTIDDGRPGYWLSCGGHQQIHISDEPEAAKFNLPSRRHAAFQVSDMDAWRKRLEQAGAIIIDNTPQLARQTRLFARDPWGNLLEFVELEQEQK